MATATGMTEHWVTARDGHAVYVNRSGDGPAIVCCNGIGCDTAFWRYIRRYFRERHTVVTWDYRGHGRTRPPADLSSMTIAQLADDLRAVLDDQGIDRAVLIGHSMGSQLILEFYRRHPDRVRGLVPLLGTYGRPIHTFFDLPVAGKLFPFVHPLSLRFVEPIESVAHAVTRSPLAFQAARLLGIVNPSLCKAEDMDGYFAHLSQLNMKVFLTLAGDMAQHTTEDILADVKVPVLVIGGEQDRFTPVWLSQEMHEMIPGSELLIVPGGSHAALVEQPELINLRIEKFIRERVERDAVGMSGEAAVLSTSSTVRSYKH